nr:SE1561 family protein [Evansella caseinilytica]
MNDLYMGNGGKLGLLHQRMDNVVQLLDSIDPEKAGVEEIDQIIAMLDELEAKCKQYRREMENK